MSGHEAPGHDHQELFKSWLRDCSGLVFKVARGFAPTEADRQDLIQEILLQMWRSIPRYEGKAKGSTWVYRVAMHTALAWQRKEVQRRVPQVSLFDVPETEAAEAPDLLTAERREMVESLYEAIRQLPKVDACVVMLSLDGLSYREMAEILGVSENHVGVKLNRARERLAKLLKGLTHEV
jgi:RNA polymerase sigma-70 factor (ECF subfamily)